MAGSFQQPENPRGRAVPSRPRDRYWQRLRDDPVPGLSLSFPGEPPMVVTAFDLLDGRLPQPDGSLLYDLLTRSPRRRPGAKVPLAEIGAELSSEGLDFERVGIDLRAIATAIELLLRPDRP